MGPNRIGVIADDLTGGASIAGELVREGWPCRISGADQPPPGNVSVVLDTGTRFAAGAESAHAVSEAVAALAAAGFQLTMKKIDSSLKGNAAVEIAAYLAGATSAAIITPACPAADVSMRHGIVFKGAERGVDVVQAMAQEGRSVGLLSLDVVRGGSSAVETWLREHPHDLIAADAQTQDDLDSICAAAIRAGLTSFVGSYGMGAALARAAGGKRPRMLQPDPEASRVLFLVGSASDRAREQVERLILAGATEIELDVHALLAGHSVAEQDRVDQMIRASQGDVVIHTATASTRDAVDRARAAAGLSERGLAQLFAEPMAAAVRAAPGTALVLVGGETTGAVTELLGINSYDALAELQPAVPFCRSNVALWPTVVTKPGSFGELDSLVSLSRALRS